MAIGVVTDKDFELELSKCSNHKSIIPEPNKPDAIVIDKIKSGRPENSVEVPQSIRKVIGEEYEINGRQSGLEIAKQFDVSNVSAAAYANGATSTASYNKPDGELKDHINKAKNRIAQKAKSRLIASLNEITPEKLKEAKLRDISGVARDMAAIVKDMEPAKIGTENDKTGPTFVFYNPGFKKEEYFETINAPAD